MVHIIKANKLRNGEFIAYGKDVITFIDAANPVTLKIDSAYLPFKADWEQLSDFYVLQRGSVLTDDLVVSDTRRDDALIGIATIAEGYARHFDPAHRAAAERVLATINKYGKAIHKQNFLAETETIRNLVQDFETDILVKNALTLLGLSAWVTELKDANNAFNQIYLQRASEASTKPEASLADKRKPALELYRTLVKVIEARQTLDPTPAIASLIAQINELVAKYNQLVQGRSGKPDSDPVPPTPAP